MVRPRPSPRTTSPRSRCGRPSRVAASAAWPSSRAWRIRVEETIRPSISPGPTISNDRPDPAHQSSSVSTVPTRSRPKPKVGPSTRPTASNCSRMTRSKNSRAVRPSSQGPVWKTPTSSAPASRIRSTLRAVQVERRRRLLGPQDGDRVGVEGQGDGRDTRGIGDRAQSGNQASMAAVDAVEVADREHGPAQPVGHRGEAVDGDQRAVFLDAETRYDGRSGWNPRPGRGLDIIASPGRGGQWRRPFAGHAGPAGRVGAWSESVLAWGLNRLA